VAADHDHDLWVGGGFAAMLADGVLAQGDNDLAELRLEAGVEAADFAVRASRATCDLAALPVATRCARPGRRSADVESLTRGMRTVRTTPFSRPWARVSSDTAGNQAHTDRHKVRFSGGDLGSSLPLPLNLYEWGASRARACSCCSDRRGWAVFHLQRKVVDHKNQRRQQIGATKAPLLGR
jgi:hypothetical protein